MKHARLLTTCFPEQLSAAPVDIVRTASAWCLRKSGPQVSIQSRQEALHSNSWTHQVMGTADPAWRQPMREEGSAPSRAQQDREPRQCTLQITPRRTLTHLFSRTAKAGKQNHPLPAFNIPSRAANGKCYSGANWGQPSVGTPRRYAAKW